MNSYTEMTFKVILTKLPCQWILYLSNRYLLPDKQRGLKQKTGVVKRNCNPQWNHTFVFEDVSKSDLKERCVELTVWDHDKLSSNEFLGGLRLNLGVGEWPQLYSYT